MRPLTVRRILAIAILSLALIGIAAPAARAASIAIAPMSGPVGTLVSFHGTASECDEEAGDDAEVFLLVGNFAGSAAINPRTTVEAGPGGAFVGTWAMPDPSLSPAYSGATSYPVGVRCIDAAGVHDSGAITEPAPTFTFTAAPAPAPAPDGTEGSVDACGNLTDIQPTTPIGHVLDAVRGCVVQLLRGNAAANTLVGDVLANVIEGLAGNDALHGRAGDDTIRAGAGNDRAWGDQGADRIWGDTGSDVIVGGAGRDRMYGSAGRDSIDANDRAAGDLVDGGPGTDSCTINRGDVARGCERIVRR